MPKLYISEIQPNQEVASSFVVEEKQLRAARNGTPFLTLKLVDKSGRISGRIWERAEACFEAIVPQTVVFVRGRSDVYRDELQLQIQEVSAVPVEAIDPADFLPVCDRRREELLQDLGEIIQTVKKGPLRRLLTSIQNDAALMDRFAIAPAAKSMHHAYLGGLLEHSLAVAKLVSQLAAFYPNLNRDLLLAGALIHDIGKIEEFVYDLTIDYSTVGRLIGHMVLGVQILEEKVRSLRNFPVADALLLKHLILSHHGDTALGAVKLPMTQEALVLHFADDLDAKMNHLTRILGDLKDGDATWTSYQRLFERFFFRGFPASAPPDTVTWQGGNKEQAVQLDLWPSKHEGEPGT